MTYVTGDIPVGAYSPTRLANLPIGHAAIDGGGGYTYFNPQAGCFRRRGTYLQFQEFRHPIPRRHRLPFRLGMSQFLSKQVFVGFLGYGYQQLTDNSGAHPILGGFRTRVFGIGPQLGYLFPIGDMQGYLNLKAYGEFAALSDTKRAGI